MNRRQFAAIALVAGLVTAGAVTAQTAVPDYITAALADPARPQAQRDRDAARKPGELLVLAEVKPGDKVGDFIIGGGYFTRIFAAAVGPNGKVFAYQPKEFIEFNAQYGTDLDTVAGAYPNVVPLRNSLAAVSFPEPLDVLFTAQNYHDFHLGFMPAPAIAAANKAMFDSLKPGGVLIVIDHYAADGSGTRDSNSLHRIDIEVVKKEITAAGFVLESQSDILRNPSDDRTVNVFREPVRGKTDQFVLKFRKPK
ncbi:MAG: class I SAM-dependent methyltransferase [Caulobacter sp.]|jgi:predicted methyltransferase